MPRSLRLEPRSEHRGKVEVAVRAGATAASGSSSVRAVDSWSQKVSQAIDLDDDDDTVEVRRPSRQDGDLGTVMLDEDESGDIFLGEDSRWGGTTAATTTTTSLPTSTPSLGHPPAPPPPPPPQGPFRHLGLSPSHHSTITPVEAAVAAQASVLPRPAPAPPSSSSSLSLSSHPAVSVLTGPAAGASLAAHRALFGPVRCLEGLVKETAAVGVVSFAPALNVVAIGADNGDICVVDVAEDAAVVASLRGAHLAGVTAIDWSWDGLAMVSAGRDGSVKMWATGSPGGSLTLTRSFQSLAVPLCLTIHPLNSNLAVTGDTFGRVMLLNFDSALWLPVFPPEGTLSRFKKAVKSGSQELIHRMKVLAKGMFRSTKEEEDKEAKAKKKEGQGKGEDKEDKEDKDKVEEEEENNNKRDSPDPTPPTSPSNRSVNSSASEHQWPARRRAFTNPAEAMTLAPLDSSGGSSVADSEGAADGGPGVGHSSPLGHATTRRKATMPVSSLVLSDDGGFLVTADTGGWLTVLQGGGEGVPHHYRLRGEVQLPYPLWRMDWSPKRRCVLVAGQAATIRLYAVPSLEVLHVYFHVISPSSFGCIFTPNANSILCSRADGTLSHFKIDDSKPEISAPIAHGLSAAIAISPDGSFIVASGLGNINVAELRFQAK
jgi:WD40 repeat protein